MFSLPYQTTVCGIYPKYQQVIAAARRAEIDLPFPLVETPGGNQLMNSAFVTPREEHEAIPNFTQIINVGEPNKPRLLIDSRQYMKFDARSQKYSLIAQNDWQFQCVRLALNNRLLSGDEAFFNRLSDLPAKVFHRWVSGVLITRYNLPIESQMALFVITAYYYYAMSTPELRQPGEEREKFAPIISRCTSVPPEFVLDVAATMGKLENASDLIHEMSVNSRQQRTGELKFGDLFALISTSWFGVNSRENVGVALEHLPTFIALLYMAIAERSYRKTVITQRVESLARGNELKVFTDLVFKAVSEQFTRLHQ
ncbi:hypothetical protein RVBP21_2770 [Pseudomonas phage BRkr]|nr:hypothetical protein RVBP21_2770 [Pseudomonas phage BRkr]